MNFKKWLCVAASLAMAASIFTGCGDSEESSTSTVETTVVSTTEAESSVSEPSRAGILHGKTGRCSDCIL